MDFSLDVVDPSLFSSIDKTLHSSALEYLTQHDFDLSTTTSSAASDGLFGPVSPTMVPQTIEPSQLSDYTLTPSSSPFSSIPSSPASSATSPSCSENSSLRSPSPPTQPRQYKRRTSPATSSKSSPEQHEHHAKRHQTKLACTWCRKLSKKCDEQRPCGRCVQFNRCSECVDAPPRKPRAKGIDRGTYKKTRDLAVTNYSEAVARRENYLAKQAKKGRVLSTGLTADELLEKARKDARDMDMDMDMDNQESKDQDMLDVQMDSDEVMQAVSQPFTGVANVQGGSIPFTGPLEDLFTCAESPEVEELLFPLSDTPDFSASSSSTITSLEEVNSPSSESSLLTDYEQSPHYTQLDRAIWEWQALEQFPALMQVVATARESEKTQLLGAEELQLWSEIALAA